MPQRRDEILFEVFLAIMILIFLIASFYYSPRARLVPLVVGFFSLGLILYQISADFSSRRPERGHQEREREPFLRSKFLHAASFAFGCGALILFFGYFGCMGMVMLGLTRLWFKESWLASLTITASLLLFSYLLFTMIFAIDLYPGIILTFAMSLFPE